MTQFSRFWNGTVLGDAVVAPYDADREFADVVHSLAIGAVSTNRIRVTRELNSLAVTGTASPLSVNTGIAFVDGTWYVNDAAVSVTVPTPAASTRFDWIVLEKDWATQTVRIVRVAGVEGAGAAPALTQTLGTKWQAPLAYYSVTTGGVVAVFDYRDTMSMYLAPRCSLKNSAAIVIGSGAATFVAMTWDTEVYDLGGMHGGSSSQVVIPEIGGYAFDFEGYVEINYLGTGGQVNYSASAIYRKNGVATDLRKAYFFQIVAANANTMYVPFSLHLEDAFLTGEYVELLIGESSNGTRLAVGGSLTARRVW